MRRIPFFAQLAVLATLLVALCAPAAAQGAYKAETPKAEVLYQDGNGGRYLLGGQWLFRLDPGDTGIDRKFFSTRSTRGWTQKQVPYDWTAGQTRVESMLGDVGWYRKDFNLPDQASGAAWIARFESANYRATVWLNGRQIGEHTGGFLPFEVVLRGLKKGVNSIVVRVDSRREPSDLPPGGPGSEGNGRGGWWNYSGLIREVYLRRVRQVDMEQVRVTPTLAQVGGPASVDVEVTVRNYAGTRQAVQLKGRYGTVPIKFPSAALGPGSSRVLTKTITVPSPRLWSPTEPNLYTVTLSGKAGGKTGGKAIEGYKLVSGVRQITVTPDGRLTLNGRFLNVRGFGLHEDNIVTGGAPTNAIRDQWINWTKQLGATILRSHEPWSPYLQEQADRRGVLLWSEIPVWSVESGYLGTRRVRAAGLQQLRENILANGNHPSILNWSIGNELSSMPGPSIATWVSAATRTAKQLDPTRPVALALVGYPPDQCFSVYAPLDMLGLNTYFGWYPAGVGQTADRQLLSGYLDTMRGCYGNKALMVTEYGVEANRSGPPEEKGTYEFQDEWTRYTLGVYATKPWLAGAVYWTLQEFRVRPGYTGNNPLGEAPYHQNGPLDRFGNPRPIFNLLQQAYSLTPQVVDSVAAR